MRITTSALSIGVLVLLLLGTGCAHATRPLPGTPCCGVDCAETCWPKGRIGPVCPELCEECEEPVCPPPCRRPGAPGPYRGPVLGKMSS